MEFTASFAAQRATATSVTGRAVLRHGSVDGTLPEPVRPAPQRPSRITPDLPATHSHARQISGNPAYEPAWRIALRRHCAMPIPIG